MSGPMLFHAFGKFCTGDSRPASSLIISASTLSNQILGLPSTSLNFFAAPALPSCCEKLGKMQSYRSDCRTVNKKVLSGISKVPILSKNQACLEACLEKAQSSGTASGENPKRPRNSSDTFHADRVIS